MKNTLTHLDLFSGIGGFALAAQSAGFKTIGFCENDKKLQTFLQAKWPGIPIATDVRDMRGVQADLVTGGFPCQPFTTLGSRRGQMDDRWLWPAMLRVIKDADPAWVLGENVAGFIGLALETVLSDLEAAGFEVIPMVIPACAVEAHHRRDRVWLLAWNTNRHTKRSWKKIPNFHTHSVRASIRPAMPLLHRAAHGLPGKLDRLHALGNAIVPQVAEVILRGIAQIEGLTQPPKRQNAPRARVNPPKSAEPALFGNCRGLQHVPVGRQTLQNRGGAA